ncbi:MAG: ATP-binding cassette domain-containing protein [Vibrio toranzoniae]|uniref:ATP-binding cassette domain-containing protein n=1 Tax=Vibrio toranzoniae TaxID=1194427 RepID=UPI001378016C|nr:ATP-binding cassette domain-containing protein [Vibrio toranzoniae]NAZ68980.1 ATP-binding cassette domain-containing protein [Vibrio toranzoniae]
MIVVKNTFKSYRNCRVVDMTSTTFEKGEVTSIIVPNRTGKSPFLFIASNLTIRDSGSVFIDSKELSSWSPESLVKHLSVLRQSNSRNIRLTVKEMLSFWMFSIFKKTIN